MNNKNNKFDLIMRFLEVVKIEPKWNIDELCKILDINDRDFEYILSTISEIYISNDFDLFIDIEIKKNIINIEFNSTLEETQFITDNELISLYKFLHEANSELLEMYIDSKNLKIFLKTLSKYISLNSEPKNNIDLEESIIDDEEIIIDYSPIGDTSSYKYHIKPISLVKNNEGVALLGLDINENKPKTFLIQRIFNISKNIIDLNNIARAGKNEIYILNFEFLDSKTSLIGFDEDSIKINDKGFYSISFTNRLSALEFYKKNIFNIKAVNDTEFINEIKSSLNKLINLINK